ncbi:MAG: hypothetical protein JRF61_19165 [Deltaproteobacteria bacterium]|jgi:hypothetical protein|nr:hypothetical protein [Deltaproteobacteria bacterium]
MGTRLIVLLPIAALMTAALFVFAAFTHSLLERRFVPEHVSTTRLVRYESACDRMEQRLAELAREATACDADPGCLVSPLLCPIEMTAVHEREYERLRDRLERECGSGSWDGLDATPVASDSSQSCDLVREAIPPEVEHSALQVFIF